MLEDDIQLGHHMLLMRWGLLHWASAARAVLDGADRIAQEHLVEGLRHVEQVYGFHSLFGRIFRTYPLMRPLMARLFDHPLFIYAMGRGEWEASARRI